MLLFLVTVLSVLFGVLVGVLCFQFGGWSAERRRLKVLTACVLAELRAEQLTWDTLSKLRATARRSL